MIYWRKILIQSLMCGFLSTIALTFLSCDSKEKNAQDKAQIPVNMQKITTKNVELDFEYPARLKSLQSVNVYARVEGVLLAQEFKEGEIVQEGQKLFKIDPTRYQARVNVAKAQYSSAKANLTKATKDWNRVEKLYKQGVLTVDQYDQSLYDYQSALANVENTKASLDDALIDLNYTDVMASITGRTGIRRYDVGNLVGRGNDSILTTITQLSPIYAEFSIPNNDFYYMRNLNKDDITVTLLFSNGKVYEKSGKIDFIDSVLDEQTASVKARAIIDNDSYKLLPSEFIRVQLQGFKSQESIVIPQNAVLQDSEGSYVYVAKDGKAHITRVVLGKTLRDGSVLIVNGLHDGDIIITNNLSKLQEGTDVIDSSVSQSQ